MAIGMGVDDPKITENKMEYQAQPLQPLKPLTLLPFTINPQKIPTFEQSIGK